SPSLPEYLLVSSSSLLTLFKRCPTCGVGSISSMSSSLNDRLKRLADCGDVMGLALPAAIDHIYISHMKDVQSTVRHVMDVSWNFFYYLLNIILEIEDISLY
ncbi:hypothetical protein PENTCL1PPCAC_13614, partial [Pristionchus entomophagus]